MDATRDRDCYNGEVFRVESSFRRSVADVELATYRYHLAKVKQVDRASYRRPQSVEKSRERYSTEARRNHGATVR